MIANHGSVFHIRFLRSKGCTVFNMIEIRKPCKGKKPAKSFMLKRKSLTAKFGLPNRDEQPNIRNQTVDRRPGRTKSAVFFCPKIKQNSDPLTGRCQESFLTFYLHFTQFRSKILHFAFILDCEYGKEEHHGNSTEADCEEF